MKKLHPSLGLLLIRVAVGAVFMSEGYTKFQHIAGTVSFFASLGVPGALAYLVMAIEILGGALLIVGVASRYLGFIFGVIMIFAIYLTGINKGFKPHEFEVLLGAASFGIALMGSGRYSLRKLESSF